VLGFHLIYKSLSIRISFHIFVLYIYLEKEHSPKYMKLAIFTKPFSVLCLTYVMKAVLYKEPPDMKLRYEHNKGFHDTCLVYLGNDQKRDFFRDFHKRDKLRIKSATFYPVIRIIEITC
jgi:hypothetical protein